MFHVLACYLFDIYCGWQSCYMLLCLVKCRMLFVLNVSCLAASQPGECNSYHDSVHMSRTVKEDVLHQKKSTVRQSSVTLVTQLDSRRLERLVTLVGLWKGTTYAWLTTMYVLLNGFQLWILVSQRVLLFTLLWLWLLLLLFKYHVI